MYDVSSGECDKTPVDKNAIYHMSCIPGGYMHYAYTALLYSGILCL